MVLPHRITTNRDKIREAIIKKIKKIASFKRQHPHHTNVKAKFLYFKEPIGKSPYRIDKIGGNNPYHEDNNYEVSWSVVTDNELIEMYQKVKNGETYCFFLEQDTLGKQAWNNDTNQYESV